MGHAEVGAKADYYSCSHSVVISHSPRLHGQAWTVRGKKEFIIYMCICNFIQKKTGIMLSLEIISQQRDGNDAIDPISFLVCLTSVYEFGIF